MQVTIPPIKITQGKAFRQSYRIEDPIEDSAIMPLGDFSAALSVSAKPFEVPFFEADLTIADNRILVDIPADSTAAFPAMPILGGQANGIFQINLTDPGNDSDLLLQGTVTVAGQIE